MCAFMHICIRSGSGKRDPGFEAAVNAERDRNQTTTTATVHKPIQQMQCGIGVKLQNDFVTITSIRSGGLFTNSGLEVGMAIKTINNVSVIGKTAAEATQLIKDAVGQVTIVATGSRSTDLETGGNPPFETYSGTFDMSYVDQGNQCRGNVTLELKRNERTGYYDVSGTTSDADGTAYITEGFVTYGGDAWWVDEVRSGNDIGLKVLTTGKFDWSTNSFEGSWRANTGQSGLYSSFESTSVTKTFAPVTTATLTNATPAATAPTMSAVVATPVIESYSQPPIVTAVAESPSPVVVATANKERKDMTVGIGIKAPNGSPVISSIQPDSLFATSALRVGMDVQSINNQSMSGKTASEATQIIRDAVGEITVVAGWNLSVSPTIDAAPIASAPPAETGESEIYVPSYR